MEPIDSRLRIIGIGQEWRGDDAAGLLVVRQLRKTVRPCVTIVENFGAMTDLIEAWKNADAVIMIDAMQGDGPPGKIYRFPVHERPLPANLFPACSTHAWGVAQAAALGLILMQLPPYLVVYGIEGRDFGLGQGFSPEVARAIPEVVLRIVQEINEYFENKCKLRRSP